jgi:CheY-like chemotaxis protein
MSALTEPAENPGRILVVDDEANDRELLKLLLTAEASWSWWLRPATRLSPSSPSSRLT